MADNKTVDNNALTDYPVATDEVTYSGDTADIQIVRPSHVTGTEGAKTAEAITQTTGSAVPPAVMFVGGTDGTNARALKLDASGEVQVDVLTMPNVTIGAAIPAGTNNIGDVDVLTVPAPLSTTGGGTEAAALRVTIASDSTGVVSIDDNGGSLTVDGTVAVSGTVPVTDNAGSLTVDAPVGTPVNVQVGDGTNTATVRNLAANDALNVAIVDGSGGHITSFGGGTQYTEGDTDATITGTALLFEGAADTLVAAPGTAADGLLVNLGANNDVTVTGTVTANLAAGTNNIGDVDVLTVPAPLSTTGGGTEAAALRVTLANDSTGVVSVDDNGGSLTVDGTVGIAAGTNNIGDVDVLTMPSIPAGTNNIGDVDVLTLPALPAGTNNIGDVDVLTMPNVTLAAGTNTNEVVGDVAHSAGVAGNPILVCGVSQDTDDTAPPNRVDAESDATRLATDHDGALYVRTHGPQVWSYHLDTSTAQTDATVHAAPGAGLSLYVGTIVFSNGAGTAINLFFEEGASKVLGPYYLEAVSGRGMTIQFNPPKKITANTALTLTTSASIAHCVDVTGFTAND